MREKKVEEAMRLVWDSLQSHLPYTYGKANTKTTRFHKKCVREYALLLKILSELN